MKNDSKSKRRAVVGGARLSDDETLQEHADIIADLIEDEETPAILYDILTDFVLELSAQTDISLMHPTVIRAVLPEMLRSAEKAGISVTHGHWERARRARVITESNEADNDTSDGEAHSSDDLAGHLAAVMSHPETPDAIRESLMTGMNESFQEVSGEVDASRQYIKDSLEALRRRESEGKGGAS